jgi:hypothetical protein
MKKTILAFNLIVLILSIFIASNGTFASDKEVLANSKTLTFEIGSKKIDRKAVLEAFFEKYNSPLKKNTDTFIEVADKYGIDYRLIPAISCMESTCGKFLIEGSYNPFGWGIYGDNAIYFKNYDEAIKTVGEGLNEGYFVKGFNTVEKIAPIYTPPNSINWKNGVNFFMNRISDFE